MQGDRKRQHYQEVYTLGLINRVEPCFVTEAFKFTVAFIDL